MKMKKIMLVLTGLALFQGCAHQTIHEYCEANASHYGDYQECYQERSVYEERREQKRARIAQSFSQMGQTNNATLRCMPNGLGGMNCK